MKAEYLKIFKKIFPKYILAKIGANDGINGYAFDPDKSPSEDIIQKYGYNGDLIKIFTENKGQIVHKWHHYIPIYEKYFADFRGRPIKFLEIGVSDGGSLQMWRNYFGEMATIYGIDINPDCAKFNGLAGEVRIGSQADINFLGKVLDEMGGIDLVLGKVCTSQPKLSSCVK